MALNSAENEAIFAELEQQAQEDDVRDEDQKKAIRKRFDPKALSKKTAKIYVIEDPDLGDIRFGYLTESEFNALGLNKDMDSSLIAKKTVWAMLRKAQSDLTFEEFEAIPHVEKQAVIIALTRQFNSFLRYVQRNGLMQSQSSTTKQQSPSSTATP